MRLTTVLLSGCAASANIGAIQHPLAHDLGGSVDAHLGLGRVIDPGVVLDANLRGDVGDHDSRLAFGGSVLASKVIANGYRVLARAGLWRAIVSSVGERAIVPTFELAAYIPLRESPDPGNKFGWSATGVVVGVREDLDLVAYTTLFVGYQVLLVPGY